jgi:hypothetical protein
MGTRVLCSECINKQEEIYRLREKYKNLKKRFKIQERKITEGYFGSSTPSSKKPLKKNSNSDNKKKKGGAKKGHTGNGRTSFSEKEVDSIRHVDCHEEICADCNIILERNGKRNRSILDIEVSKIHKILYKLEGKRCPICKKIFRAKPPQVLPRFLLSNQLLSYFAHEHYINGTTLGRLEEKTGVGIGTIINAMHHLSTLFENVPNRLIEEYRNSELKHADESSWRNDGANGYAWLFGNPKISIYRFRQTRASSVVREVLGEKELPGVLVVDRYNGYNRVPCKIQYCYAHLIRNIQDLEKQFPKNSEVKCFVEKTAPLLSKAMKLRNEKICDNSYYRKAKQLKQKIIDEMAKEANHAGIQKIQNIFREKKSLLEK